MLKSSDFYNFKGLVALIKDMIDKSISDSEVHRRIKSGQLTPYLDYKGAAHLTKNGEVIRGIDHISGLFEEEFYISGIFKLSHKNIILSEFCLEAILGVGNPVAQKKKIYSISNKNLKNIDLSLGYCLYNIGDKVNRKYSETDLKCEIVFDREDLLDIVSEYKQKQRFDDLENELKETREYIERIERERNLLRVEISRLNRELQTTKPKESTEDLNDVKDSIFRLIYALKYIILGLDKESKALPADMKSKFDFSNQGKIVDHIANREIPKLGETNIETIFAEANKRNLD